MPTYVNRKQNPIVVNNVCFKFQEPTQSESYIDVTKHDGLELVSEEPHFTFVLNSQHVSTPGLITLTDFEQACEVRIVSLSTTSTIAFNDTDVEIVVPQQSPLTVRMNNSRIKYIKLISGEINIELWKPLNWV